MDESSRIRAAPPPVPEPPAAQVVPEGREIVENTATQCTVCLCDFEDGDHVRVLPCRHAFHRACIDPSLALNRHCPNCRSDTVSLQAERESLLLMREMGVTGLGLEDIDPLQFGPDIVIVPPQPPSESADSHDLEGGDAAEDREVASQEEEDFMSQWRRRVLPAPRSLPLSSDARATDAAMAAADSRFPDAAAASSADLPSLSNPMRLRSSAGLHGSALRSSNRRIAVGPIGAASAGDSYHRQPRGRTRGAAARSDEAAPPDSRSDEDGDSGWRGEGGEGRRLAMQQNPLHYGSAVRPLQSEQLHAALSRRAAIAAPPRTTDRDDSDSPVPHDSPLRSARSQRTAPRSVSPHVAAAAPLRVGRPYISSSASVSVTSAFASSSVALAAIRDADAPLYVDSPIRQGQLTAPNPLRTYAQEPPPSVNAVPV
jgi:hypothetical protein